MGGGGGDNLSKKKDSTSGSQLINMHDGSSSVNL